MESRSVRSHVIAGSGVQLWTRLVRSALVIAAVLAFGTLGYHLIEGATYWDSFYMTAITLTTVGYREVFPLSQAGQAFTVLLLLAGLGMILLVATDIARTVLEGELIELFGHARRSRMIERMSKHEIVCGWGRMGEAVVDELRLRRRASVVVVEHDPEKVRRLTEMGVPVVAGDATSEAVLRSAGVERAHGLVACLDDDAHNVYTVLTARSLNPNLFIVARASEEGAEARILRAGANRAVNLYQLGGSRLAHLLVKPTVVDFLDFSLGPPGEELRLEEALLLPTSPLAGRTLAELDLRRKCGVGVVAVRRAESLFPNPEANLKLEGGDVLIVLGTNKQLETFEPYVTVCGDTASKWVGSSTP
ncbi:MAG: potassium channel protein [Acidobacteriota bacterium]